MHHSTELGIARNRLIDTRAQIVREASPHSYPRELLLQNAERVDNIVRKAFQKAQSQAPSPSVCLMAVGGYGRAELAPHSDVDLVLLHSSREKSELSPLIERTLYPLWDLGLEVNCSSRSIPECLRMARSDLQVKTSLIDGRYLDGEYELFRSLCDLFTRKVLHYKVHDFADAMMKELRQRHQKYNDPAYILEPNVKEGEGGLRDFQIGRWMVRARYKTDRWDSILFPDHSRSLDKSLQFLWAVRNQLHLLSGRRQDDLTFELQEKIAPALGFPAGPKGIEEMMREYHLSAQRISNFVTSTLERNLSGPSPWKRAFFYLKPGKVDKHFRLREGELSLLDPTTLKKDPSQLMALFGHCQKHRVKMDFRTEEAVLEALPFIDDRFISSERVNRTFLSILGKGDGVETILKKMGELGFLSRYIPEFSEIEGKVHYDLYHVHPVDIHSILAVGELERLRRGSYENEYLLITSLMKEVENPGVLFLTALLHDIGKGGEGDHSLTGAAQVGRIATRIGLSKEDRELAVFLVSRHLFMIETALRRDLQDEQTILRFANEVKSLDRLKMLYLLTFADVKAVGPEAWTSWKDSLLMELFLKTSHLLERDAVAGPFLKGDEMIRKLKEILPPEEFSRHAEHLPDRYLSCYPPDQIVHHIEMARSMEGKPLVVEWQIEKETRARVTLCTKDRYGLFSKIAGSMFVNRLNILEAQIHTWGNGIALDTFWVEDATKDIERRLGQFEKSLSDILTGEVSLKDLLSRGKETSWIQQKVIPKVPGEVKINNEDSDFYTIVEVTAEDRLGILYEITQALTDHGCDIHFARIATLGNRIVDVFYIQDTWGEKIKEREKIGHFKQTLLRQLTS